MPLDRASLPILVDGRFQPERRGGDRCRYELCRHLAASGANKYAFLAYDETESILQDVAPDYKVISTRARPWNHPWGDWFEHVQLPRVGQRLNASLYHGTFNVLPAIRGLSPAPRMVVTIHDVAPFKFPEAYSRAFGLLARRLTAAAVRRADHIIAISSATKSDLVSLFPAAASKISVIFNGVGDAFTAAVNLPPNEVASIKARLKLPPQYVLFVGNLERKKNLPRLVAAFRLAKAMAALPQHLVIVGSRPQGVPDAELSNAMTDPFVMFTGAVDDADLPAVYRGADLLAFPSIYEGFGMPVLEGMAAGLPVLTSSLSPMAEVADGTARLVDPLNVDDIARGLVQALTDEAWRLWAVQAGQVRAARLSWAENARLTAIVYINALADTFL